MSDGKRLVWKDGVVRNATPEEIATVDRDLKLAEVDTLVTKAIGAMVADHAIRISERNGMPLVRVLDVIFRTVTSEAVVLERRVRRAK